MPERINPYIAGAPVTDPTMFFGREDVFTWIEQNIAGRYADNTLVIHGQRRVGKTSVLKQLDRRLPERHVPVFFDFQGRTHTTLDQFLWRLAREIVRTLRTRHGVVLPKPERDAFTRDPEHFAGPFLAQVREAVVGHSLLLVFDEFDTLEEPTAKEMLARDLIPYLSRLLHGAEQFNCIFSIGSSGHKLEHMQADYTDFFRSALYKKISFLEPGEAQRLIVEPVRDVMTYDPPAAERVLEIASGHPYFTQLTCHELFAQAQRTDDWHVRVDTVEAALPDVIERGTVNLKFVWDDATDAERYTLAALGFLGRPATKDEILTTLRQHKVRISEEEVGAALLNLNIKDVLAGEHRFTVDLLRLWLLENRPMERVVEELAEKHPIAVRFTQIAEEYREQGLPDRALESFRSALEATPDYMPALLGVAEIHHEAERWEETAAAYRAVLELDDENIQARIGLCEANLALGDRARAAGDTAEAQKRYRQVLEIHEAHAEARERLAALHLARAEALVGHGQWKEAGEAVAQAWAAIPEDLEPEGRRAAAEAAHLRSAEFEQALAPLRRALATMRAQLAQEQVARAAQLRERKRFGAAMAALQRALEYAPASPEIEQEMAATREAERAQGLDKLLTAGERALQAERWGEAIRTFERFLALEPEDAKDVETAKEWIGQARERQELAEAYAAARQAMDRGNYRQAATLFGKVTARDASYRDAAQLLGEARTTQRRGRLRKFLWAGAIGVAAILLIVLGWWLTQPESPLMVALATPTPTVTATPSPTPTPTNTPLPTPTPAPGWLRLYDGAAFERDKITLIRVDPQDPDVLYAGTYESGIYKSPDGGTSWQPSHGGPGEAFVWNLVIDPDDPQTLYAISHDGRFDKTTDGGLTWQAAGSSIIADSFERIALDPQDSQHLYVASKLGMDAEVHESRDGGESWEIRGRLGHVAELAIDPQNGDRVCALGYGEGHYDYRVYRSDGPGAMWEEIWQRDSEEEGYAQALIVAPGDPPTLYLANGEHVYHSQDGGDSWALLAEIPCYGLAGDPHDAQTLYCWASVSEFSERIRISHDGGQSWGEALDFQVNTLAFAPDGQTLYAGGLAGLFVSSDGGASWSILHLGLASTRLEIQVDPRDSATVYALELDGWRPYELYRSVGGATNWQKLVTPEYSEGLEIDPTSGTLYRFDRYGDEIYHSADGGETWATLTLPKIGIEGLAVHPHSGQLYALYDDESRYVSADGGLTWEHDTTKWPVGDRLYFDGQGEITYLTYLGITGSPDWSTDGGLHWNECDELDWDLSELALDPSNGRRIFAATGGGGVWASENGCLVWAPSNEGLENLFVNAVAINPANPNLIYAGTNGGAYISRDGGEQWEPANNGLLGATVVYDIVVDPNDPGRVYAATPLGIFRLEGR